MKATKVVMPELVTKADILRLERLMYRQKTAIAVRIGSMLVVGVGLLAALAKLI